MTCPDSKSPKLGLTPKHPQGIEEEEEGNPNISFYPAISTPPKLCLLVSPQIPRSYIYRTDLSDVSWQIGVNSGDWLYWNE